MTFRETKKAPIRPWINNLTHANAANDIGHRHSSTGVQNYIYSEKGLTTHSLKGLQTEKCMLL